MSQVRRVELRAHCVMRAVASGDTAKAFGEALGKPFRGSLALSRRTSGIDRQQPPLGDDEVGQPEQAGPLRLVLGQTLAANLLVAQQVLDDAQRMLDLRAHTGLTPPDPLKRPIELVHPEGKGKEGSDTTARSKT